MALKSSIGVQSAVRKRDRAHDQILFNEKYPEVVSALIDESTEKKIHLLDVSSKKRLLDLEIAATPIGKVNEIIRAEEISKLEEKQKLPRRAVEQSAKRLAKKSGEDAGENYRQAELAKLDKALEECRLELLKQFPESDDESVPAAAISAYEAAKKEEEQKMAELLAKCETEKKAEIDKLKERLSEKNKKLKAVFEHTNQEIREYYKAEESHLDKDSIMSFKNVKMYFDGVKAVDDLSFEIKKGEIFGIIGPNGAGKTTLFNCITQFNKATSGKIYYRDKFGIAVDLSHYSSHDIVKTGIARTFQNLQMMLYVTALDNLLIGAHPYYRANLLDHLVYSKRLKEEEQVNRAVALEILEKLDLVQYAFRITQGLPYGVLKKIELARTLMTKPSVIILDEPAAGLNEAETEKLAEVIKNIRDEYNCTIILVEHDMNLVMSVCDTVCAMSFGKLLAIGAPEEIQNNKTVQEAYLGEEEKEA